MILVGLAGDICHGRGEMPSGSDCFSVSFFIGLSRYQRPNHARLATPRAGDLLRGFRALTPALWLPAFHRSSKKLDFLDFYFPRRRAVAYVPLPERLKHVPRHLPLFGVGVPCRGFCGIFVFRLDLK